MLAFRSCTFGSLDQYFSLEVWSWPRCCESQMFGIWNYYTEKSSDWEIWSLPNWFSVSLGFSFSPVFCFMTSCGAGRIWRETRETDWHAKHITSPGWIGWVSWWFRHTWWASEWNLTISSMSAPTLRRFPIIWVIFCGTQVKFQLLIGDSEFTMWHDGASLLCFYTFLGYLLCICQGVLFLRGWCRCQRFCRPPLAWLCQFCQLFCVVLIPAWSVAKDVQAAWLETSIQLLGFDFSVDFFLSAIIDVETASENPIWAALTFAWQRVLYPRDLIKLCGLLTWYVTHKAHKNNAF